MRWYGVEGEHARSDGSIAGDHARLVDFGDVRANHWLVVSQFPVIEGQHDRRRLVMSAIQHVTRGALRLMYGNSTPYMARGMLQLDTPLMARYSHKTGITRHYRRV